jgi:hypothetical protein
MSDVYEWPISDLESVEFHIHDLNVGLLNAAVVYIFARQKEDGWLALYAGQVENAKEQLSANQWASMAAQNGATHLHMMGMTSPSRRKQIVEALIEHLQPPLNLALREAGVPG